MYIPRKFALTDEQTAAALAAADFAQLVSHDPSGLLVTPLPLIYDPTSHSLIGHVSRANPHWHADGAESVAIFAGPRTPTSRPNFYATKSETGKVVPTWNYEVLNVYGRLVVHDDPDWVLDLVTELTNRHEAGRPEPWQVTDAPETYTAVAAARHRRHRARHRQGRRQGEDVAEPARPQPGRRRRRASGVRLAARSARRRPGRRPRDGNTNANGRG